MLDSELMRSIAQQMMTSPEVQAGGKLIPVRHLAIDLRQRLLAAHSQNRVPEAYEQDDECQVTQPRAVQPSE